jgi:hypothetical protein
MSKIFATHIMLTSTGIIPRQKGDSSATDFVAI